jgi:beta-lactam-binding protein with PASTA domain
MYYNGGRSFLISFLVSFFTSVIVCVVFFFVIMPMTRVTGDTIVPDLVNSTTEQARVIAESRGLLLVVGGEEESDKVAENLVCRQAPMPGSMVNNKTTVTVFVSKGSSQLTLPDFSGKGLSEATVKLSEMGLRVGEVRSEEHAEIAKDKIISTIPGAGSPVEKGDVITVVLSRGVEVVSVPRLIGKSLSSGKRIIEENGFTVGNVSWEVSTEFNVGIIMRQSPRAGEKAKKGSPVNLVVATVLE